MPRPMAMPDREGSPPDEGTTFTISKARFAVHWLLSLLTLFLTVAAIGATVVSLLGVAPLDSPRTLALALTFIIASHAVSADPPQEFTNSIGMKLRLIPAGEFMMGTGDPGPHFGPRHKVRITKPFYLGVYEVTQAEYEGVMGENPSKFKGASNPVEQVSWNDAVQFCKRLSAKEGKTYRLPTEAEWEYAARGPERRRYPWGDEFDGTRLNYCDTNCELGKRDEAFDDGYAQLAPVGSYPDGASWIGALDMAGNVSEWTSSKFAAYPYDATDGREAQEGETERVTRGGSWHSPALRARNGARGMNDPFFSDSDLGFRLAGSSPQGTSL